MQDEIDEQVKELGDPGQKFQRHTSRSAGAGAPGAEAYASGSWKAAFRAFWGTASIPAGRGATFAGGSQRPGEPQRVVSRCLLRCRRRGSALSLGSRLGRDAAELGAVVLQRVEGELHFAIPGCQGQLRLAGDAQVGRRFLGALRPRGRA